MTTVAVTGPTGDIGRALLRALDEEPAVERVLGMARRPFDPASMGLQKTEYRQGDVLDRGRVDAFAAEADVLVHLAFIILGGREETRSINLEGSRNVFEAARDVKRLVYTSSVAAYGFHADNPQPLTEDVPTRGTDAHYYSAQKAELEETLRAALDGTDVETYVFRPCIVAGGDAPAEAVGRLPFMPAQASWINAMRVPVVMDTSRARRELGWEPRYDTVATLNDTVAHARERGLL